MFVYLRLHTFLFVCIRVRRTKYLSEELLFFALKWFYNHFSFFLFLSMIVFFSWMTLLFVDLLPSLFFCEFIVFTLLSKQSTQNGIHVNRKNSMQKERKMGKRINFISNKKKREKKYHKFKSLFIIKLAL